MRPNISYSSLFFVFFKIGAFTFGGGWAMIALIERELVDRRAWLTRDEFLNALALSQTLPGILAVNISIYTGNRLKNKRGALAATLGTILPSFLIMLSLALFFTHQSELPVLDAIFRAVRPAVVALIVIPVLSSAKNVGLSKQTLWIPLLVAFGVSFLRWSPIRIILTIICGSLLYGWLKKRKEIIK